jgi:hypothetical protein
MHGGRSTGPRTKEGLARLRSARTIHGMFGATMRTRDRHLLTLFRRGAALIAAMGLKALLPPELIDRLNSMPPELRPPPQPSGEPGKLEDRAAMLAEAAALAPWKLAIATARLARRDAAAANRLAQKPPAGLPSGTGPEGPHAPEAHPAADAASCESPARPHAPVPRAPPLIGASTLAAPAGRPPPAPPERRAPGPHTRHPRQREKPQPRTARVHGLNGQPPHTIVAAIHGDVDGGQGAARHAPLATQPSLRTLAAQWTTGQPRRSTSR